MNAAVCDLTYKAKHKSIVIELEARQKPALPKVFDMTGPTLEEERKAKEEEDESVDDSQGSASD